ncbi:MAG: hypothetical protein M1836_001859 [Candelina mexicana]|nr:MAG: hypothetical protein M1836_001859 [Candelina mexicana]
MASKEPPVPVPKGSKLGDAALIESAIDYSKGKSKTFKNVSLKAIARFMESQDAHMTKLRQALKSEKAALRAGLEQRKVEIRRLFETVCDMEVDYQRLDTEKFELMEHYLELKERYQRLKKYHQGLQTRTRRAKEKMQEELDLLQSQVDELEQENGYLKKELEKYCPDAFETDDDDLLEG